MKILIGILFFAMALGCASGPGGRKTPPKEEDLVDLSPSNESSKKAPIKSQSGVKASEAVATPTPAGTSATQAFEQALRSKQDEQIQQTASALLAENPNSVSALNALGLVAFRRSQWPAAEYFFRRGVRISPENSDLMNNLGLAVLVRDESEAIPIFKKALQLNPKNTIAAANVGAIYLRNKDFEKAIVAFDLAGVSGMSDFRIQMNYASALVGQRRFDKAGDVYDRLMSQQANNRELLYNVAIFQVEHQNKFKEGLDTISKLKFLGPSSDMREKIIVLENKAKAGLK